MFGNSRFLFSWCLLLRWNAATFVTDLGGKLHEVKPDFRGIVVRILHHVQQIQDGCIFVAMILFGEKAAWVRFISHFCRRDM